MQPLFTPPLYRQRYDFVIDFVQRNKTKKVVDLGCGECSLLQKLRFRHEIQLLAGVDLNGDKVKTKMYGLAPISTDYLQPTYKQLCIELYQGSVTQRDPRLRGFDLVTSIELIEHLTLDDLECFADVVFGYMIPVAVIISTPNFEYNPHLPLLQKFRHYDHKFEWTRAEFQSWALKVCAQYDYEVEFTGVGLAPPGLQEAVGFCSQIGVFYRSRVRDSCNMLPTDDAQDEFSYKLLCSIKYPSLHDNNTLRRVLLCEVLYWAERIKTRWMEGTAERDETCTFYQTEEEVEECPRREKHTACGAALSVEGEDEQVFQKKGQGQWKTIKICRYVCVPLSVLWRRCPRIGALSGTLCNLRHLLMDNPQITLSKDGTAVLLKLQDPDEEEKDDLEDSGNAKGNRPPPPR